MTKSFPAKANARAKVPNKTTHIFYTGPFYAVEDIEYLCPECISSGEAARKYDGCFQDDCSLDNGVDDPEKLDELIHRKMSGTALTRSYGPEAGNKHRMEVLKSRSGT